MARGFTLIELVVTMTILGVVSAMIGVFIAPTMLGYVATEHRAEMVDAADTTLRRIARDVRAALPNSLRQISGGGSTSCFEFIPITGGGRYRAAPTPAGAGDILDFTTADTSFDFLSGTIPAGAGKQIVIWNTGGLGPASSDAYTGGNVSAIGSGTTSPLTLSAAKLFPRESPGKHFFVIPGTSTVYSCTGGTTGQLVRSTRALPSAAMAACPSSGTAIVDHVDCSNSSFNFTSSALSNYGLLAMTLVLLDSNPASPTYNERVRLYQEVQVNNVP